MVRGCGGLISRFLIYQSSSREFALRSLTTGPLGSRSFSSTRLCCRSIASNRLDICEFLNSQAWNLGGFSWRPSTKLSCSTISSGIRFPGSRAYVRKFPDNIEENTVMEAAPSSCSDERNLVGGRYCILLTGHASDYTYRLYGGYAQMFVKLLGDPQDIWDVYPVMEGVFPSDEDVEKYDGFVLTGSRHDAHGNDEWILKLCSFLQSLHKKKRKMLGVCFGHQVMSRALGGKTGRAEGGWEVGIRKVQLTDSMFGKPYAAGVPPVIRVYEVHRDQVQEIPPGAELLGYSEKTGIEMFSVGDNVFAIQGHPEFTEDILVELIDSRLSQGILKKDEAKIARESLKEGPPDTDILQQMCKAFLKG